MQSPQDIDDRIDDIIKEATRFVAEGVASDSWQAHHRHHFLKAALGMLDDWNHAKPCPIRFARFYKRQAELSTALSALSQQLIEDLERNGVEEADPDYLQRPQTTWTYYRDQHGVVEDFAPDDIGLPYWPNICPQLNVDASRPPRFLIGDVVPEGEGDDTVFWSKQRAGADGKATAAIQIDRQEAVTGPASATVPPSVAAPLTSELLEKCLSELREDTGKNTAESDVRPYIEFFIHVLGDRPLASYSRDDYRTICRAFRDMPSPSGTVGRLLIQRYEYGQRHGLDGLKRISETTIENRVFAGFRRFWKWCRDAEHFQGPIPTFTLIGGENSPALERDSFNEAEIRALFEMPSFSGHLRQNRWKEGPFLSQDGIYWSYVIGIYTGMRPSEIAQLRIEDIKELNGVFWFDLRPFDPAKGRVARKDIKAHKTGAAGRLVPIHPALFDVGLMDRAEKLEKLGHKLLFPDIRPGTNKGNIKFGHAHAKDWQRRKSKVTNRANVSAYSARHAMADLLRALKFTPHECETFMGHAHERINGRYGRKMMPAHVAEAFLNVDAPIMHWLREHLISARDRAARAGSLVEDWAVRPAKSAP